MGLLKERRRHPPPSKLNGLRRSLFIGVRKTTPNSPVESTSLGLDAFATFKYGRLREMPQASLEFVVFFDRHRSTQALSGNSGR